jgi:hypothetical protein
LGTCRNSPESCGWPSQPHVSQCRGSGFGSDIIGKHAGTQLGAGKEFELIRGAPDGLDLDMCFKRADEITGKRKATDSGFSDCLDRARGARVRSANLMQAIAKFRPHSLPSCRQW